MTPRDEQVLRIAVAFTALFLAVQLAPLFWADFAIAVGIGR
jgi:hypothetical protein